jgi:multiple sugar transport system ATP-binding protein
MRGGKVQQIGKPEVLYNFPANVFVAGFIGSPAMNILPGRVESGPEGTSLVTSIARFTLPAQITARLMDGVASTQSQASGEREVMWGVRAEDIRLVSPETGAARAAVDLVEGLGSDAYVSLTVGQGSALGAKDALVVRTPSDARPSEGETVGVMLNLSKLHLFDPQSEETILRPV